MLEQFGGGSLVRCPKIIRKMIQVLGWAAGEASSVEIYASLRQIADEEKMHYSLPEDALAFMKN